MVASRVYSGDVVGGCDRDCHLADVPAGGEQNKSGRYRCCESDDNDRGSIAFLPDRLRLIPRNDGGRHRGSLDAGCSEIRHRCSGVAAAYPDGGRIGRRMVAGKLVRSCGVVKLGRPNRQRNVGGICPKVASS